MAHKAQQQFFENVKGLYPEHFEGEALDCGSLDVNGSLAGMFHGSKYTGIDIAPGKNVHVVASVEKYFSDNFTNDDPVLNMPLFDTIVSGEMLEHDEFWKEDFQRMIDMLKPGGLLAMSCAGKDRPEHGTTRTGNVWGTSNDYYRNIEKSDLEPFFDQFSEYDCMENRVDKDTYFYGIKK